MEIKNSEKYWLTTNESIQLIRMPTAMLVGHNDVCSCSAPPQLLQKKTEEVIHSENQVHQCEVVFLLNLSEYRKTPLISTYVISGLAMVQVLIFGAVLTFGGYDKAEAKILQGRSLFNLVFSVDNALLCMFQQLWTYFQDIGVLIFGGMNFRGIAADSKFL